MEREIMRRLLRGMLLARAFEERATVEYMIANIKGFLHLYPGEEAVAIGQVSTFFGNFGMFVRAYAYIRRHGAEGLRENSEHAVLNANYLRVIDRPCHELLDCHSRPHHSPEGRRAGLALGHSGNQHCHRAQLSGVR